MLLYFTFHTAGVTKYIETIQVKNYNTEYHKLGKMSLAPSNHRNSLTRSSAGRHLPSNQKMSSPLLLWVVVARVFDTGNFFFILFVYRLNQSTLHYTALCKLQRKKERKNVENYQISGFIQLID